VKDLQLSSGVGSLFFSVPDIYPPPSSAAVSRWCYCADVSDIFFFKHLTSIYIPFRLRHVAPYPVQFCDKM
jgi:hypothetical protein